MELVEFRHLLFVCVMKQIEFEVIKCLNPR